MKNLKFDNRSIKTQVTAAIPLSIFGSDEREDWDEFMNEHARSNEGVGNVLTLVELRNAARYYRNAPDSPYGDKLDRLLTFLKQHGVDEVVFV